MNKERKRNYFIEILIGSVFIVIGMILIYTLYFALSAMSSLEQQSHNHQLELLKIEKEIALINLQSNNLTEPKKDFECEYKLMNLTNYYNNEIFGLIINRGYN